MKSSTEVSRVVGEKKTVPVSGGQKEAAQAAREQEPKKGTDLVAPEKLAMKNKVPFSTTKNNMENKRPVQQQQQQQLQHRVVAPLPPSSLQPQQHRPTTEEEEKAKREKARARGMAFLKVGTSSKPSMKTKSAAAARQAAD